MRKAEPQHCPRPSVKGRCSRSFFAPRGCFVTQFLFPVTHSFSVPLAGFAPLRPHFPQLKLLCSGLTVIHFVFAFGLMFTHRVHHIVILSVSVETHQVGWESSCWLELIKIKSALFFFAGLTNHIIRLQEQFKCILFCIKKKWTTFKLKQELTDCHWCEWDKIS